VRSAAADAASDNSCRQPHEDALSSCPQLVKN